MDRYYQCPQCQYLDTEWEERGGKLIHTRCGWVSGTRPEGHPVIGDVIGRGPGYWRCRGDRFFIHPETRIAILGVHNAVTGTCGGFGEDALSSEELAALGYETVIYAADIDRQPWSEKYAYANCLVVGLPETWKPVAYYYTTMLTDIRHTDEAVYVPEDPPDYDCWD